MTGGDTINARFLHENSFDFSPKFKLYINTNYLPVITDMTLFSSGRVVIIPFERHFDESEQDKSLKREFAKPENQSAILNWLIEGYQLLKKEGLTLPDSVKTATEAYKRDSDKIALFFEDALEESPNSEVRTSEVYDRYQRWCMPMDVIRRMPETSNRPCPPSPVWSGNDHVLAVG
ncbi:phage/plasmid primase, P4 family [Ureibacillus endophyticus]|uniref:phage/plasmid primase, P4 family n=1 Tax=Ureibacillus endophyticus TaxID=1978490 RepID=UPI001FE3C181|nr:phage/plasmid primase, P4 family [Lysinibacillus endophyticus]